jgi:hypothetical protein
MAAQQIILRKDAISNSAASLFSEIPTVARDPYYLKLLLPRQSHNVGSSAAIGIPR